MGVAFSIFLTIFILTALLVWFQVGILSPEVWLVIISALAFGVFAFRPMSAYVLVITVADHFIKHGEVKDEEKLVQKSGKTRNEINQMPLSAVLSLVLAGVEPFKYSLYLGFVILLLLTLAVGFLPEYPPVKSYVEALFWGAAISVFVSWTFENFAETAVAQLLEVENSQTAEKKEEEQTS